MKMKKKKKDEINKEHFVVLHRMIAIIFVKLANVSARDVFFSICIYILSLFERIINNISFIIR